MNALALLESKLCVITGAGRGIGKAIAQLYAEQGARLALVGKHRAALEAVAEQCIYLGADDDEVTLYVSDLTDPQEVVDIAEAIITKHASVDVLVNSDSLLVPGSLDQGDPEQWNKMFQVNVLAPMRLAQMFAPTMASKVDRSYIINVASKAGLEPYPNHAAYSASMFGLRGWTASIREALKDKNIGVCGVYPGWARTDVPDMPRSQEDLDHRQLIQPTDVAEAALLPFRMTGLSFQEQIVVATTHTPAPEEDE